MTPPPKKRPLRILMLAPQPFFQPRGTPISVYFRLKALSHLGHHVDLVTYHLGEDKSFRNVTISRIANILGIQNIKIGPSLAKIPMDTLLAFKALEKVIFNRYDLIFSHEEASWIGAFLAKIWRIPHIYDMHSSLPQQLINTGFTKSTLIISIFRLLERMVLNTSKSVIVICPDLQNIVIDEGFGDKTTLLENFLDFDHPEYSENEMRKSRSEIAPAGEKILLYAGNFQPYQGVALLFEAMQHLKQKPVKLLLVGGKGEELSETQAQVERQGLNEKVFFTGQVPPSRVPFYVDLADGLASPRTSGTNTPLKVYSFLKSGKPFVATRLWTHTQVLNEEIAVLADPDPESFAHGIETALFEEEGHKRAEAGRIFAEKEYVYSRYLDKINRVLDMALGRS